MFIRHSIKFLLVLVVGFAFSPTAMASSPPTNTALFMMLQELQGKLEAVTHENKALRKEMGSLRKEVRSLSKADERVRGESAAPVHAPIIKLPQPAPIQMASLSIQPMDVSLAEANTSPGEPKALIKRVEQLEKQQHEQKNVVTGGDFPGSFKLPGTDTSVKIGGYIKVDFIYDIDQKGGAMQDIPKPDTTKSLDTGHFQAHARQSRLNLETRTPTDWGLAKTFFEMDFFGTDGTESFTNSNNPRLLHGYGSLGPVLAGQTWTTFNSVEAYPETIDFEGPAGQTFIRQAQLRYTHDINNNFNIQASIENPETVTASGLESGRDRYPDFIVKGVYKGDWGVASLSGVARELNLSNGINDDRAFGWGLGVGARINMFDKDNLRLQLNGGEGIGRYIFESGKSGNYFSQYNDKIRKVASAGGFIAYQHWWTDKLRTNAVYGGTFQSTTLDEGLKNLQSGHLNLIWSPVATANIGLEYSIFDADYEDDTGGRISRIQLGVQYLFGS